MAQPRPVEQLYTYEEVATLLRVHTRTVRRWIKDGIRSGGQKGLHPVVFFNSQTRRIPASALSRFCTRHTLA